MIQGGYKCVKFDRMRGGTLRMVLIVLAPAANSGNYGAI